jgi:large subunit ribosomal protein L22
MKAVLKNYRQSPRKVRLVADMVRGKGVEEALATLTFVNKRSAGPLAKLIRSAIASARSKGLDVSTLIIKKITVDEGTVYRRFMPRARGSASPINRRNSHINIELAEK